MTNRLSPILLSLLMVWVPVAFFYRAADGAVLPKTIVAVLVGVFFLTRILQEKAGLWRQPLVTALLLFTVWMVGDSFVVGLSKWDVLQGSGHIFVITGTFLAVLYACSRGVSYEKQVHLALWVAGALALYGLVQALGLERVQWDNSFERRAFATFGNPDFFAGYLAALFPLAFVATLKAKGRTGWLFYRAIMVLLIVVLAFTKVLGAFLALAVGLLVLLLLLLSKWGRELFKQNARFVLAVYGFLVIGVGAYLAWHGGLSAFLAKEKSFQQRMDTYQVALEMVKDHPWTGIGLGQLGIQIPPYQAKPFMNADPGQHPFTYTEHVHNEFLQFWVEGGIPGLGLFLAVLLIFGVMVGRYFKAPEAEGKDWMLGVLSGFTALMVQSLTNIPLQVAPTAVLFGFFLVAPLALRRPQGSAGLELPKSNIQKWVLALVLLAAGGWASRQVAYAIALRNTIGETSIQGHGVYAVRYGQRLTGLAPSDPKAWRSYGDALEAAGRGEEAYQAFQKAIELNPNDVQAMDRMADLRMGQGQYNEAIGLADRALAITPNYPGLFLVKAQSYFRLKRYEEAAQQFKAIGVYQPNNPDVYLNLGVCSILLGQKTVAVEYWKKAYSLNPNDAQVVQYLKSQGVLLP